MSGARRRWVAIAIAAFGVLFQLGLQGVARPHAIDGLYFHSWSSEAMMQTVPIEDLIAAPGQALAHIHIQPPAFDTIRAILVHLGPATDAASAIRHVDAGLYLAWTLAYGALGAVVFLWLSEMVNRIIAGVASVVLLFHPAAIYYATFLDTTLLSSVLVLSMYYFLWKASRGARGAVIGFAVAVTLLFYTRAIFPWPAVVLMAAPLALIGVPRRQLMTYLLVAGTLTGVYVIKQYRQFDLGTTSSFTGLNLAHSIGLPADRRYYDDLTALPERTDGSLPRVLTRKWKSNGALNFNRIEQLEVNREVSAAYWEALRRMSAGQLLYGFALNTSIYFKPSDLYHAHVIADRLPWRSIYHAVFSFPVLPALLLVALIHRGAASRGTWRRTAALLLPALFIFTVCVLFERTENMRYKFFLEPVMYVFLVTELMSVRQRARDSRPTEMD